MHEIYLYGTVGAGFWDEDCFTPADVRDALAEAEGPIMVRINSGGGSAPDGQAIYNLLKGYPDRVEVVIDGVAASAASLIAMAGETITMRAGALMMIHDPAQMFTPGRGTEDDHRKAADTLALISTVYARIYASRSGMSVEAARDIMRAETYYDGPGAVAAGFADVSDDAPAQDVAAFDYRIYSHAPPALLGATNAIAGPRKRQSAILAMMAGTPAHNPKGTTMENDEDLREDGATPEEETQTPPPADPDETSEAEDDPEAMEGEGEDDPEAAQPVAAQILDLVMFHGWDPEIARDMIARNLTLSAAVAEIQAKLRKENPVMNTPRMGGPRSRIVRDERSTRRLAMTEAIGAQIARRSDVGEAARPFMDMSLVEMAAICAGRERDPIRSAGQRLDIFMAAAHSTSDFPAIFENALNKVLLERYQVAEPTYRKISRRRDFKDFRPHPMVRAGDFPKLQPVAENGEIKFGTFGEAKETAVLASYGSGIRISRQMMINDDLGAIDDVLSDYGAMIADFEEETFYAFFLTATLSDGNPVFHASHNNLAGSGAAISVASVAAGRAAIRKQTSIDGKKLNMAPAILLVGPDKETEAEQLVAAIQPQETGKVNPFSGRLEVVTTAQITGNPWFLLAGADRPGGACFVHGFLDGGAAPRVRTEEPFGQQGVAMTIEHDFGLGAIDYRGGWKNPGA